MIYDIFSVFRVDVSTAASEGKVYKLAVDEEYPDYLKELKQRSNFDTGIEVSEDRQTILLSTCSYASDKRCVVCGIAREKTDVTLIN